MCHVADWQSSYLQPHLLASRNARVSTHPDPGSVLSWLLVHPTWKHAYGNQRQDRWPWQHSPRDREMRFSPCHWRNPARHKREGESSCWVIFVPFSIWEIFKSYYPPAPGYLSPSLTLPLGCTNLTLCYLLSCHYKLQTIYWLEHGVRGSWVFTDNTRTPSTSCTIPLKNSVIFL